MRWPLALLLIVTAPSVLATDAPAVPYPQDYRSWQHVKTMLIEPGHPLAGLVEGLHHLYANPTALAGYRSGHFGDGAVIVLDLLQPVPAEQALSEGPRKAVIVMHRDHRRYAATGGWGFEVFGGDSHTDRKLDDQAAQQCFACHASRQAHDYVFSEYRP